MNDFPSNLQICEPEIHITFNLERKGIISSISANTKLFFQKFIEDVLVAILKKTLRWLSPNTHFKFNQSAQRIFNDHLYVIFLKMDIDTYTIYTIIIYPIILATQ